jgi:hypothetical protein
MLPTQPLATFTMSVSSPVLLSMPNEPDLPLCAAETLQVARPEVDFVLARFKATLDDLTPSLESLKVAVRQLDSDTARFALMLTDQDDALLKELTARFARAWPSWRHENDIVPFIEVRGQDHDFPFELLPLFSQAPIPDFDNYAEAEVALRRFLGFGLCVRRDSGTAQVEPLDSSLPMQIFAYDMPGVRNEIHNLVQRFRVTRVEGPWPGDVMPADPEGARERLIDVMFDPTDTLSGAPRTGVPVQIQHFACHADTQASGTDAGYTLRLGSSEVPCRVSLTEIRNGFRHRDRPHVTKETARPLVVLNACGSATVSASTRLSFQRWFLSNNYRGFVGTETDVPDGIGAAFAERLYATLLGARTLGEAVVIARRELFRDRGSPLGLLYVMYGDPRLSIEP